jgi:hypothetical protein
MPVERWLPRFDVRERHARIVLVSPEAALEIALGTPVAPDPIVRTLFRLLGLPARAETIGAFSSRPPLSARATSTSYALARDLT